MKTQNPSASSFTRREFVRTSAAAAAGFSALMAGTNFAYAAGSDRIRVGLVGAGGRGTGAARDCAVSAEGVDIVAMADLFEDRLDSSRKALQKEIPNNYKVTDKTSFTGFDCYKQVIDSGVDLVILAAPPGFRPLHLRAAIEAGKHVFAEKPTNVDVAGYHSIVETGEMARQKNLSIVAGTLYRRQPSFVESIRRVHEGMIGEIVSAQEYYMTGPIWLRARKPGMSDMEWQCRNWYYFTWLSGDHIVEQFVHNLDAINWVMQSTPESAVAMGGRQVRVDPSYGHIYDHFSVEYVYPKGVRVEAKCRQMDGTTNRVTNRVVGTEGIADIHTDRAQIRSHSGKILWETKERGNNAYVAEHTDLINAIRTGKPINEAKQVADSSLTGVLGRESAYTGKEITWDELLKADLDLVPRTFTFGELEVPPVAHPGVTTLNRSINAPKPTAARG